MNINCETILDFYMHKNKKILCQIKVSPNKSRKFKNTCRCLTQEQWNTFDQELEKLINKTHDWNDEKCLKFNIKSYIEVEVQKSKLSLKHFYKCLGAIDEYDEEVGDVIDADYVLECLLNFKEEVPFNTILESQEYEPQTETSPDKLCSPLNTPSKKKYPADNIDTIKTPGIDYLEYGEDTYSPISIFQIFGNEPLLTEKKPIYTPAPIRNTRSSRDSNKSTHRDLPSSSSKESKKSSKPDLLDEVIVETGDEIVSPEKSKSLRSKLNKKKSKKREIEYIPKSQEHAGAPTPVYIPTPIVEKKTDYEIRKHKKQSMTTDEYPRLLLDENSREKSKTIKEHISIEKSKSKNLPEESKEKPCKKSKEEKSDLNANISSTKEKPKQSQKKPEIIKRASSSSEDEFLTAIAKSKKSSITKPKASDDDLEDGNKIEKNTKLSLSNDNANNLNISISSATEAATDTSPQNVKRGRKQKESRTDDKKSLRRSERSPSKPVRFMDEQHELLRSKKQLIPKTSPKNKDLFGTDDDDDEEFFENNNDSNIKNDKKVKLSVFETPVGKKSTKVASSSSSSSSKKKRKRDKSSECEQEKRDMNTWLSKKKTSSSDKDSKQPSTSKSSSDKDSKQASTSKSSSSKSRPLKISKKEKSQKNEIDTESRPKSETQPPSFELPSMEEMELMRNKTKLMQKENAIVRAELDKMRTSPPKEVEILSLQSVPLEDILNTFVIYKSELDEIYENNCKRDYIKGHDGINHCFVIRLLQPNIQMKMLEKLTDVYSNTKSTTQATLYANALLPEWVIRVYMEKFKFSRQQAINQIKAQEAFQLHMEEQSDHSFMFD